MVSIIEVWFNYNKLTQTSDIDNLVMKPLCLECHSVLFAAALQWHQTLGLMVLEP